MDLKTEIGYLLEARFHLIHVVTSEERRAENEVAAVGKEKEFEVMFWDCSTGVTNTKGQPVENLPDADGIPPRMPHAIFPMVRGRRSAQIWILRDIHQFFSDPQIVRGLKSLHRELSDSQELAKTTMLVLISPTHELPPELQGVGTVVDCPLPTKEELEKVLEGVVGTAPDGSIEGTAAEVVDSGAGLPALDFADALARCIVEHKQIIPRIIGDYKKRVVERERVLQWYEPDPRGLDAIGGLALLKAWLEERRLALSQDARDYGLPAPRGVLLVGEPGNGKSLTAKAVPAAWGLPLLRLDLGALKSKYVGASEQNIRKALRVAEAISPVVLWLDEVEKALAGSRGTQGDGGVSADALAAILTWLQEHKGMVFLVATSNDATMLPPEFSRKGRFDEIFYIGAPQPSERAEVLRTHITKVQRDPELFDLNAVAAATHQFSGAELEEVVKCALFRAFSDGKREPNTEDLLIVASETKPIATTYGDKIRAIRDWAEGKTRPASLTEVAPVNPVEEPAVAARFAGIGKVGKAKN